MATALASTTERAVQRRAAFVHLAVRPWPWRLALVALTATFGLAAAANPKLAIMAAFATVLVPLIFLNFALGVCVFTLISFLDVLPELTGGVPVTKAVGLLLVGSWLLREASQGSEREARRGWLAEQPWLMAVLLVFLGWSVLSMLWAERPSSVADSASRFALNFALFPIVFAALREGRHVALLFASFVTGVLGATFWGLLTGAAATDDRLSGAGLNPNQLGTLLAVGTILAVALSANRAWSPPARLLALGGAVACMAGMLMTVSREAFLGLGVAVIVAPFAVGGGRRAAAAALAVLAMFGAGVWFELIAPQSAVERVTHVEYGGNGRQDLWRIGWRMVESHPIGGVGAGNYPVSSVDYLLRPGRTLVDTLVVYEPKVPHNIYLNVFAELGVVGMVLFVAILGLSLRCALSAARIFAERGEVAAEMLARGLFIALVAFLAADFFSSQLFGKQLWLLLAVPPALRSIATWDGYRARA